MSANPTSDAQQALNKKYSELCQQLGSLSYQRSILDAQVADLSAQIKSLNDLAPTMRTIELELKAKFVMEANVKSENSKTSSEAG